MLVRPSVWRTYNSHGIRNVLQNDDVNCPTLYSAKCMLDPAKLIELQIKPGDVALVQLKCPNETDQFSLCTIWALDSRSFDSESARVDGRVFIPADNHLIHFFPIQNQESIFFEPVSFIYPLCSNSISVASNIHLKLQPKSTQSSTGIDFSPNFNCPKFTAMIKRSLRQICVCKGATISVPFNDQLIVFISVFDGAPRLSHAWRITNATIIYVDTIEDLPDLSNCDISLDATKNINAKDSDEFLASQENPDQCPADVSDLILELILLPMISPIASAFIPRGILLSGPPGVGKTYAVTKAAMIAESIYNVNCSIFAINGSDILGMGGFGEGEAKLRRIFDEARMKSTNHNQPNGSDKINKCCIIFMDEMDALFCKRTDNGSDSSRGQVLTQLLMLMDGFEQHNQKDDGHILVIGATNMPDSLDPALRRPGRFDKEISILAPDSDQRLAIIKEHCKEFVIENETETLVAIANKAVGYVAADLAALVREAALSAVKHSIEDISLDERKSFLMQKEKLKVTIRDFEEASEKVGASSLRGHHVDVPQTSWDDIGGLDEAKMMLKRAVEWPSKHGQIFLKFGISAPRGILLFGPPGCCKTTLVRAAATGAGSTFVSLSGADIYSPYLGDAEAAVRRAFTLARGAAPAILFFDELDAIVTSRSSEKIEGSSNAESRVLATFLNEMDGIDATRQDGVIVVGATNRPNAIDPALLRPGRFDKLIYVPLPDQCGRNQIFSIHTRNIPLHSDVDIGLLASMTEGFTGAEIESVCREGAIRALRESGIECEIVCMRHFEAAIDLVRPGITSSMEERYQKFKGNSKFNK